MPSEQDSVWKEVLDTYFEEFISFFFPHIHKDVDWARGYEFLDKELEKIVQDSELGRRLVDKLVKVYLTDGKETWLLIHIEVQGKVDREFARRMYTYNYRITDRYNSEVISLGVLTDKNKRFRPRRYVVKRWGFLMWFQFPIVKLIDYNKDWEALEANPNPFAVVVMAQLKALEAKKGEEQLTWKLRLVRMLYERKYVRQEIINLFRFIDWLIRLPKELEQKFEDEVTKYEEARMPYVTSIERNGIEKGRLEGVQDMSLRQLKRRFGELTPEVEEQIMALSLKQLEKLGEALLDFADLDALKKWLRTRTARNKAAKSEE